MKYYDSIYKNDKSFCGARPNKLLVKIKRSLKKDDEFLDLGCGQGKDSVYMSRLGLNVTAIDSSKVAISQIKKSIQEKKIANFTAKCQNIKNFIIQPKKFKIISSINALQFLAKKDSLNVIKKIKKSVINGGFIVLASFTTENAPSKRRRSSFELGEMKKLFPKSEFKIIHYFVEIIACEK
jgi:tellurite methyltransferase